MQWLIEVYTFWTTEWRLSLGLFLLTWILATAAFFFFRYRKKRAITPNRIFFVGTFVSAVAFFLPMYGAVLSGPEAWVVSLQHAFRLFTLEGDYREWVLAFSYPNDGIRDMYVALGAALYAFAPLLTFGFILSFFKNLVAHLKYLFWFWTPTYVFSELNDRSMTLASDLVRTYRPILGFIPRVLIVFTDVVDKKEEANLELIEDARELGAILFRKDLESVTFRRRFSLRKLNFFLISDDVPEMIRHTESITRRYDHSNVVLRVFSSDVRTELQVAAKTVKNMRLIRVNDIRYLVYQNLYDNGVNLFRNARPLPDGRKKISVILVGLGRYGREMLKALVWYCQVPGYVLKINAFDADPKAKERFTQMCPELMSEAYNGQVIKGEPYYDVCIHAGVDVTVPAFDKELMKIRDTTYVFVSLGDDRKNLEVSSGIRTVCEKLTYAGALHQPAIETIIYDATVRREMGVTWAQLREEERTRDTEEPVTFGVKNFKRQPYNIMMIGAFKHNYSVKTVIDSAMIAAGWNAHWYYSADGKPESEASEEELRAARISFWQYEYNFYSSLAKGIHKRLRAQLGLKIPGDDKPWAERSEDEMKEIGKIEHVRWNAFMRAEGYSYGEVRNDLAKRHHMLVPVARLKDEDLRRDA